MTSAPFPLDVWVWSPPEPGPPDLIPGLLPRHGHLLIAGETDVGKTTVALEIAQAVLTGQPLWGVTAVTEVITKVAYIMGEHHESIVQSLWRLMDFGGQPAIRIHPPSARRPLVSRGITMERSRDYLKEWCQGSQLVIFDPLNAFAAGSDVENDSANMRACINAMEDVTAGGALLILGHMGKPYFDKDRQKYQHRTTYASRGSSAIEDSVTCCYYMIQDDAKEHANRFRLVRRKYKGDAPTFYLLQRDDKNCHTLIGGGKTRAQISAARSAAGAQGGRPEKQTSGNITGN